VDTAAEIAAAGGKAIPQKIDVANADAAIEGINGIAESHGRIDILVNNAGIAKDNLILRTKPDEWDQVVDTNLRGAWACSKAAVRHMLKAKSNTGRIVNISSVVGETGNAGQVTYAATKAGLIGMTRALALEVASRNVTVNAVAPGFIVTDMTDALPEKVKEELKTKIPLGRLGQPSDIAEAVAFLCISEDEVTPEKHFIDDLGADSLDIVELVMAMEENFEIEIPDEDAEKIQTVRDAINYIQERQ